MICLVDAAMTRSISDLNNITLDVESANSSPGMPRVSGLDPDLNLIINNIVNLSLFFFNRDNQ